MSEIKWSPLEEYDENGTATGIIHVMPVMDCPIFKTEQEAKNMMDRINTAPRTNGKFPPIVPNGKGGIQSTFIGHIVSQDCSCSPEPKSAHGKQFFIHRSTQ